MERLNEGLRELADELEIDEYIFIASSNDDIIIEVNSNMVGALGMIEVAKLELSSRPTNSVGTSNYSGSHN